MGWDISQVAVDGGRGGCYTIPRKMILQVMDGSFKVTEANDLKMGQYHIIISKIHLRYFVKFLS